MNLNYNSWKIKFSSSSSLCAHSAHSAGHNKRASFWTRSVPTNPDPLPDPIHHRLAPRPVHSLARKKAPKRRHAIVKFGFRSRNIEQPQKIVSQKVNQIKSIFMSHQYTKHKNENFPLTHGLRKVHLK